MEPSCRHLARSAELPEIQPQQVAELAPVPDREVLIAVVHENVRFTRLVGEGLDPRNPFLELFLRVVVTEPDARRVALRLPRLAVASVESDHREVLRGGRGDRGRLESKPCGMSTDTYGTS